MNSKLIVKNFGPIKDINISLKNVNVFIGPQASGKSALAKLFTILKAPRKFFDIDIEKHSPDQFYYFANNFYTILDTYNIGSFLEEDTYIEFYSELHDVKYENSMLTYNPKLLNTIARTEKMIGDFQNSFEDLVLSFSNLTDRFVYFYVDVNRVLERYTKEIGMEKLATLSDINEEIAVEILAIIKKSEISLSTNTALYIPAERNLMTIIKNYSLSLQANNVPIPRHLLNFGMELEKAKAIKISLGFLQKNLSYENIEGQDYIFTSENHKIKLTEAASGIQSVVPILIPIMSHKQYYGRGHRSFVIEEPELNLFPSAQYDLIKLLESSRTESYFEDYGVIHTYTSHSPYILSALNNLLYAYKVKSDIGEENEGLVNDIVGADINPKLFTAYQIKDGKAESIVSPITGLVVDNYIDEASDLMNEDFEKLMELTS